MLVNRGELIRPVNMDGSSIDAHPKPPLKLAPTAKVLRIQGGLPAMRFRAPTLDPSVALAAAMLLALPGSALAEDANPPAADAATPPVAEEVTPPATPEAAHQLPEMRRNAKRPISLYRPRLDQGGAKPALLYRDRDRRQAAHGHRPQRQGHGIPPPAISTAHLPGRRRRRYRPGAGQFLFHAPPPTRPRRTTTRPSPISTRRSASTPPGDFFLPRHRLS
jgi:hypothetical protein